MMGQDLVVNDKEGKKIGGKIVLEICDKIREK